MSYRTSFLIRFPYDPISNAVIGMFGTIDKIHDAKITGDAVAVANFRTDMVRLPAGVLVGQRKRLRQKRIHAVTEQQIRELLRDLGIAERAAAHAPGGDLYTHGFARGVRHAMRVLKERAETR